MSSEHDQKIIPSTALCIKMQFQAVLACFSSILFVFCDGSIVCDDTKYGRICTTNDNDVGFLPYRLSLADEGNLLIVGTRNFLHSFSTTNTLEILQTVDLTPTRADIQQCQSTEGLPSCEVNSILFLQQIPEQSLNSTSLQARYNNTILVCGANAFTPRCTVHNLYNLSDWFYLQSASNNYEGFSPYSINSLNVATIASNGAFYSATNFAQFVDRRRLAISFNPLSGDTSFNTVSADQDPFWVANTDFISLYEVDDYIYVFGREDSNEERDSPLVKYGRAIRICKSDQGVENDGSQPRFRTFQKIRISCPNRGDNSFPEFVYNNLQATYFYTAADGSHWIYATFISQANGPVGSAICKFSFDSSEANSLTKTLDNAVDYYDSSDPNYVTVQLDTFSCPGTERNKLEAIGHQLVEGVVLPSGGNAVHTRNGQHYTFINVDVYEFDSSTYEVMYVATESMNIEVICHKNGDPFITKTLATYAEEIQNFILNKYDTQRGIRKLYVGGETFVASIILGNCHMYSSCQECLESNDPYCAWMTDSHSCINKLVTSTYNSTHIIEASEVSENICPSLPVQQTTGAPTMTPPASMGTASVSAQNPQPKPTQVSTCVTRIQKISTIVHRESSVTSEVTVTATGTSGSVSVEPSIGGVDTQVAMFTTKEIGEMIGAGVGGLLVGFIVGILLCFAYTLVRGKVSSKPMHNSNGTAGGSYLDNDTLTAVTPRTNGLPSVEQYVITVSLPEKSDSTNNDSTAGVVSPVPTPSLSPPAIDDSELEDDVISDLPQSNNNLHGNKIKKWGIPKGRTPSTRWLRASESSNAGSESPVSPS